MDTTASTNGTSTSSTRHRRVIDARVYVLALLTERLDDEDCRVRTWPVDEDRRAIGALAFVLIVPDDVRAVEDSGWSRLQMLPLNRGTAQILIILYTSAGAHARVQKTEDSLVMSTRRVGQGRRPRSVDEASSWSNRSPSTALIPAERR